MKSSQGFLRTIVYSNFVIAFASAGMAYVTYAVLNIDAELYVLGFLFCISLLTYNFQRLIKFYRPEIPEQSERNTWIIKSKKRLGILIVLAAIGALYFLPMLKLKSVLLLIPLGFISMFYSVKFLPFRGKRIALREIPFAKIFLISITWVGATVWFPLLQMELYGSHTEEIILVSLQRFLFVFAITIPFDIRDLPYDTAEQATLPQLFGIEKSIKIARFLLLLFCLLCFYRYLNGQTDHFILFALFLSGFSTMYFVSKTKTNNSEIFYTGLLDGTMVFQAVLVFLFLFLK